MKKQQIVKHLKKHLLVLSVCAALLLSLALPAAAGDQPSHPGTVLEKPAFAPTPRLVLQIIDGKLHKWVEYESNLSSGQLSVQLLEPEQKTLSALEIKRLFEASRKWEEQQRLQLTSLTANQLLQNNLVDNRSAIDNSLSFVYPYNTIGMLTINYSTQQIRGTAFLISPYAALTNAHNLYNTAMGGWHKSARFSPGQYETFWPENRRPFSTKESVKTEVNQTFLHYEINNDRENLIRHDYGALFFDRPFEGIVTFMPLQFNQTPTSVSVSVVGYPGFVRGSPSQGQWLAPGTVLSKNENCLLYDALTSGGSSGSPVFTYNPSSGTYRVVAIHSFAYENKPVSGGPHLNNLNSEQIEGWLRWTPDGPGSATSVSLILDKTSLILDVGAIEMLLVGIIPAELSTIPLTWSSSDSTVAAVNESGLVTAKRSGRATITVTTTDRTATAYCEVTIADFREEGNPVNPTIKGDLNGDWLVNIEDVTLAQQHVLQLRILPVNLANMADVNGDGLIDVRDVNLIMRYALSLISSF